MSACESQKSSIMLDVYGDLSVAERARLKQHLEICEGCRRERQQMLGLIGTIKTAIPSRDLSTTEAKKMTNTIIWKLNRARSLNWWSQILAYSPSRLIPAVAAAGILIVIAGVLGYNIFLADDQLRPTASIQAEQLSSQDLEIIKNLDLLKDMEAIQKLVQAVGQSSPKPPEDNSFDDTRGMRNTLYGKHYA